MLLSLLRARRPRRRVLGRVAGVLVCALLGAGLWAAYDHRGDDARRAVPARPGGAESGRSGPAPTDFDGNGRTDLVLPVPGADLPGKHGAGALAVVYGTPAGPGLGRHQTISRTTPGPLGRLAATGDHFSREPVAADLDGDGYTDLLTRGFGRDLVLWGSARGLASGARLGFMNAGVGDFDGDGQADVLVRDRAVSVLFGPFGRGGRPASRAVYSDYRGAALDAGIYVDLVVGDLTGDGRDDVVLTHSPEPGDWRWYAPRRFVTGPDGREDRGKRGSVRDVPSAGPGVIADFDCDGHGDYAARAIRENDSTGLREYYDAGRIEVAYGSANGSFARVQAVLHEDLGVAGASGDDGHRGTTGAPDTGDRLGAALAAGDVDGDGCADLVAGAPGTDVGDAVDSGAVYLLMGGRAGLVGGGPQGAGEPARPRVLAYRQGLDGVPGAAEPYDGFGSALWLGDLDGDHRADLAIGAPGESGTARRSGAVWILPGGRTGPRTAGTVSFGPAALGLPEHSLAGTGLGAGFGADRP
ncbi:esterase [Streptomyces sp. NPDC088785]|uniref:esterase n=1 Tax=Streptomyces sp. NPDC088785 TaxID=3365897 RepID=UPI0037F17F1E